MSWTLTTSGACIAKAGANANSDVVASSATLAKWSDEAEGKICAECHTDFVTNYSTFGTEIQQALGDIASSLVAMNIISYDLTGYITQREAETLLDINDDRINKGLQTLKDKKNQRLST